MVKYDNLYGSTETKLHKLYAQAYPEPTEPEDKPLPHVASSQIVRGHGEARIYAELPIERNGFRRSAEEVSARIIFTDGKENHKVAVSADELSILIAELQRIRDSLYDTNDVLGANTKAQQNYREAQDKYRDNRQTYLTKMMANGKITVEKIEAAEKWEDLKQV